MGFRCQWGNNQTLLPKEQEHEIHEHRTEEGRRGDCERHGHLITHRPYTYNGKASHTILPFYRSMSVAISRSSY